MADEVAKRDENRVPTMLGENFTDGEISTLKTDDATEELMTKASSTIKGVDAGVVFDNDPQSSYLMNVSRGLIPGHAHQTVFGFNPGVTAADQFENVNNNGNEGLMTYLTANTQLFISSSSASDTTQLIAVIGVKEDFSEVTATAVINGQTQVMLSDVHFRVHTVVQVTGSELVGDIYCAESDTLTGGVPNTNSKIKGKINAGRGISLIDNFTIPKDKEYHICTQLFTTGKNNECEIDLRCRLPGDDFFVSFFTNFTYQSFPVESGFPPFKFTAGTDIETVYRSTNINTPCAAAVFGVLIDV